MMAVKRSAVDAAIQHSLAGQHACAVACFEAILRKHTTLKAMDLMEAAFAFDRAGEEHKAIPLYVKALNGALSDDQRVNGYFCLASSYRNVGQSAAARTILARAISHFPDEPIFSILLAILDHDDGKSSSAVSRLIEVCRGHIRGANISHYSHFLAREARKAGHSPDSLGL